MTTSLSRLAPVVFLVACGGGPARFGQTCDPTEKRPKKTGAGSATLDYAGPPLETGMYYQFRVAAVDTGGAVISRTEDLLGVFYLE